MAHPIRIAKAALVFERFELRTPFVYGKGAHTHTNRAEVRVTVEDAAGKRAAGVAQMTVASDWAWPTRAIDGETKQAALRELESRFASFLSKDFDEAGHPLDLYKAQRPELHRIALEIQKERALAEPIAGLAEMIAHSAFDLATHDAYGRLLGAPSWDLLGPEHCAHDLAHYLGADFKGAYPRDFLTPQAAQVRIAHTVGAADALREHEVKGDAPQDGLPSSLEGWVRAQGIDAVKLKLKGDAAWDARRVLDVAAAMEASAPGKPYALSVDANEQYPDPAPVVEMLERVKAGSQRAFDAIVYVEQPTPRTLDAGRCDASRITKFKPVIADEAPTSPEELKALYDQGWSGFGLKAGKCLSGCLLYTALSKKMGKMLTVQDNSTTGLAYAATVAVAAHVETFGGNEANGRQFNPAGNAKLRATCPSIFEVKNGRVSTADLKGPGLGWTYP